MAIAKIDKIEIIGLEEDKERLVNLLQGLGIVQLIAPGEVPLVRAREKVSESQILEIEEALSYLATYQEKPGLFKGMVKIKPLFYEQQLKELIAKFDYRAFLRGLSELRTHLKNLLQHKEKLLQEKHFLLPWQPLKIPLDELYGNIQSCAILLGILRTSDYAELLKECKKEKINLFCECLSRDRVNTHLVIIYLKDEFERLEILLKTHHFNFITLSHHKGTVEERLLEINREILVLDDQIVEAKNKITHLCREQFNLMVVYDYLANIKQRQEADKELAMQQFTFYLSGWIKHRDLPALKKALADKFRNLELFISVPPTPEEAPVDLENPRLLEPFEFITKIYGFPKYNEIDPTPYLAPFFFLYFGFCVSDVGYGFILSLISFFVLKKFRLGPQGKRFFRLFFLCGISTIIVGALTGSWFGNLFDLLAGSNSVFLPLKKFKDSLILIDPMKEPTKLLGIALSFGIIQVWFGNIVAVIGNIKNKRYVDIFLDQVPMLTFLFGLTGLGLIFLKLLDAGRLNLFKYAALSGALILALTQGRSEKGIGFKLFYGIYNLYNAISGYLSDILSYSRLWALGLVTGVMATTINLISIQFSQIFTTFIPFINKIGFIKLIVSSFILIVIFVLGHLVSFLMNLLGAFVHPVRLQFVEFFSKFFKAGGNAFRPFKVQTKYIDLR